MSNLAETRLVELDDLELQSTGSQSSLISYFSSDPSQFIFESKSEFPIESKFGAARGKPLTPKFKALVGKKSEPPIKQSIKQSRPKIEKQSGLVTKREPEAVVSKDPNQSNPNLDHSADPVLEPTRTLAEIHRRANRQARGKSFIIGCYILFDLLYTIPRFVLLFPSILVPVYWKPFAILCTNVLSNNQQITHWDKAWIGVLSWTNYLIANVLLIFALISFNLRFCYAYITLKTGSAILLLLGLITYGHECHEETTEVLYDTFIYLVIHLPLQILGVKLCAALIRSIKRAMRGIVMTPLTRRNITSTASEASFVQNNTPPNIPSIQSGRSSRRSVSTRGHGGAKLWYTT